MRTLFLTFLLPLALALGACGSIPAAETPRQKLATTEIAYRKAVDEVTALRQAGIIKPGTPTAKIIASTIRAGSDALDVWQTNPDNPQFVDMGVSALTQLLNIIANVKAGKVAFLIIYMEGHAHG